MVVRQQDKRGNKQMNSERNKRVLLTEEMPHYVDLKDVKESQSRGEMVSVERQPLVDEDVRVDWSMDGLIERWEDEPTSWHIIEGIDDGGAAWEGVGQFTGDFAGNHHELVVVEEAVFKGWDNDEHDIIVKEW